MKLQSTLSVAPRLGKLDETEAEKVDVDPADDRQLGREPIAQMTPKSSSSANVRSLFSSTEPVVPPFRSMLKSAERKFFAGSKTPPSLRKPRVASIEPPTFDVAVEHDLLLVGRDAEVGEVGLDVEPVLLVHAEAQKDLQAPRQREVRRRPRGSSTTRPRSNPPERGTLTVGANLTRISSPVIDAARVLGDRHSGRRVPAGSCRKTPSPSASPMAWTPGIWLRPLRSAAAAVELRGCSAR